MTIKEKEFRNEMVFLKKASRYALTGLENSLRAIQGAVDPDRFLNNGVYLNSIIEAGQFMNEAEQRTVSLYRKFHSLD